MKKFTLAFLATMLLCGILQLVFPWWIITVVAFAVSYFIAQKPFASFLSAFFAVFTLWSVYAIYLSMGNDHLLGKKVAELLGAITKNSVNALYLLTGFVGGLVAGFAGLTASFLHRK